jgi:hypothetical protein
MSHSEHLSVKLSNLTDKSDLNPYGLSGSIPKVGTAIKSTRLMSVEVQTAQISVG